MYCECLHDEKKINLCMNKIKKYLTRSRYHHVIHFVNASKFLLKLSDNVALHNMRNHSSINGNENYSICWRILNDESSSVLSSVNAMAALIELCVAHLMTNSIIEVRLNFIQNSQMQFPHSVQSHPLGPSQFYMNH